MKLNRKQLGGDSNIAMFGTNFSGKIKRSPFKYTRRYPPAIWNTFYGKLYDTIRDNKWIILNDETK